MNLMSQGCNQHLNSSRCSGTQLKATFKNQQGPEASEVPLGTKSISGHPRWYSVTSDLPHSRKREEKFQSIKPQKEPWWFYVSKMGNQALTDLRMDYKSQQPHTSATDAKRQLR
ncbi:hypothetical protein CB1_000917040 [Camelus ferus]|nr:hypothetical protein CB1_000917040 [Camelus ferus]